MEKQLKKIADELQLIRKELQKKNDVILGNGTVMMEAEPILSNDELIERITAKISERMKEL